MCVGNGVDVTWEAVYCCTLSLGSADTATLEHVIPLTKPQQHRLNRSCLDTHTHTHTHTGSVLLHALLLSFQHLSSFVVHKYLGCVKVRS